MKKRGQLTIFIIIGVLVVLVIISLVIVKNNKSSTSLESNSPQVQPVIDLIEECIEDTSKEAILQTTKTGGFYPVSQQTTIAN